MLKPQLLTQLTDKHLAYPMPKGAESCEIRGAHRERPYPLLSFYGEGEAVELPAGEYQIVVFNTGTATEEDARKVVRSSDWHFPDKHIRYVDYKFPYDRENKQRWGEGFGTALESMHSLLRSKGLDENKNYAIIEKLK